MMRTSKRGIESDQARCAIENQCNSSQVINRSKHIVIGNGDEHKLPSTPAFTSQSDEDQHRRSEQQTCINHEDVLSTASSTASSTSGFHSLMVRLATDDFPEYVKRNTSALTFPEKVQHLNSLFCTSYLHTTEPYDAHVMHITDDDAHGVRREDLRTTWKGERQRIHRMDS